ncbi:hypothetical protein BKA93DRAFT_748246 [Sparassis latifolia]
MVGNFTLHGASLIDTSLHPAALMQMHDIPVTRVLIEHVVENVIKTVDFSMGRASTSTRGRSVSRDSHHGAFTTFVADVIHKADVKVPVLLTTLVYIVRARPHIQIPVETWACERVFLGALIAANKYLNDQVLKNVHWAACSGVFGIRDIGRIEREFLEVLDFELWVSEAELAQHVDAVALPQRAGPPTRTRARTPLPNRRGFSSGSYDSSDLDSDSDESFMSSQSPCTPPHASDASTPFKPSLHHIADAHTDATQSHQMSAALELLRAFPIPASDACNNAHYHPCFTAATAVLV